MTASLHPLAEELNVILQREYPLALTLFSERGKRIYFPKTGILGQTAEAQGTAFNATIGIALEDNGTPLHHAFFDERIDATAEEIHTYAPSPGVSAFRALWQAAILRKNPSLSCGLSLPVVTCGLTHALSTALAMFADAGEEVLIADRHWGNCDLIIREYLGAKLKEFRMLSERGLDLRSFEEALRQSNAGKRIVLLNFPNNPTGYAPTVGEANDIASILIREAGRGSSIAVILDDAYFGFGHEDDVYAESLIALLGNAHERIFVAKVDGPTKEDCTWGHRIGCLTFAGKGMTQAAADALAWKAAGIVRATVSTAPRLFQEMLVGLYGDPGYRASHARMTTLIRGRFRQAKHSASDPKYAHLWRPLPANAGYFLCIELREGIDGNAVRRRLIKDYDTGIIALGTLLRIAYSCIAEEKIPELFARIAQACEQERGRE